MRSKIFYTLAASMLLAACGTAATDDAAMTEPTVVSDSNQYASPAVVDEISPGSEQEFAQRVGDVVHFDFDRSDVRADARPILDAQAAWLVKYPQHNVLIEGHTDERGTQEYNLALGLRRAEAVKMYLVSAGVPASRIGTTTYGKLNPVAEGSTEEAWSQNRRAVSRLVAGN